MNRFISLFLFSTILLWHTNTNAQIEEIRYGTVFKDCTNNCYFEIIIRKDLKVTISKDWSKTNISQKIDSSKLSTSKWGVFKNSIQLDQFYDLKGRIGCPECDPIGESWLEINTNTKSYRATFEHNSPPKAIEKLILIIKNSD